MTSTLGNPGRKPLTVAQFRTLAKRVQQGTPVQDARELVPKDLLMLGYSLQDAARIVELLEETDVLNWYLGKAKRFDCFPITRVSQIYPQALRNKLGLDAPGCLFAKGDLSLLNTKAVALVGSRDLLDENKRFAREVGRQAALQGYTLISGNARGADSQAQDACLEAGGNVISIVADNLTQCPLTNHVLYLSLDGYDLPFTPQRALQRNHIIHAMPLYTFIAQCTLGKGGTWDGTLYNLKMGLSPVYCYCDSRESTKDLCGRGAKEISIHSLQNLGAL